MFNFARKWFHSDEASSYPNLFPEIDYANHPYYREFYAGITEADREAALALFTKHHQGMVKQQKRFAATKKDRGNLPAALEPMGRALERDGITGLRMKPEMRKQMLALTEQAAQDLIAKRESIAPEERGVEGVCSIVCHFDNKETPTYRFFDTLLREHGIYDLCRAYKGVPYQLKFAAMQINQHDDTGVLSTCRFEDGKQAETFYMHMDSTIEVMKVIIYRSEHCDISTGAFRYIPGSCAMCGPEEIAIRKANDKCGLDTINIVERRKMFAALPVKYQKKANFGNDLIDSDSRTQRLLAHEQVYSTDIGDMLLFNPEGIHRGNIFKKPGQRQIFQLPLVPVL